MFKSNILLSEYSSYKIGGPARYFYAAKNLDQLTRAVEKAKKEKLPVFILGGGTNLVISDAGFAGLVLKPEFLEFNSDNPTITVGAGVLITQLLNYSITKGLSGLEWAGGLPGTLGGAIRGNAGAFGGEIKDVVSEVVSLDISSANPKLVRRNNARCGFGYRESVFKKRDGQEIIVAVTLSLRKGDKRRIRELIQEKIEHRRRRQPLEYPNIGSIFKNVAVGKIPGAVLKRFQHKIKTDPFPVLPAAVLIDAAGLKGVSIGGAMISPKHPGFIVNVLNARASEVKALADLMKQTVKKQFDILLEEEVIYL